MKGLIRPLRGARCGLHPVSAEPRQAVFVSYASENAAEAARVGEALRAEGIEVWFDRDELRGGDAWDNKIRGQIGACALFVPVISAATQTRLEGYFRIEWKLAARRTHAMAAAKAFLLPVVIDGTRTAGCTRRRAFDQGAAECGAGSCTPRTVGFRVRGRFQARRPIAQGSRRTGADQCRGVGFARDPVLRAAGVRFRPQRCPGRLAAPRGGPSR